jgi:transposase InsO family protein
VRVRPASTARSGRVADDRGREAPHRLTRPLATLAPARLDIDWELNGGCYKARFDAAVERIGARHKRTRRYRPQTNGKAKRFIRTLLDEWAYGRPYPTNDERTAALQAFVDFYDRRRPHTALGGRSPLDAVNNVPGEHT